MLGLPDSVKVIRSNFYSGPPTTRGVSIEDTFSPVVSIEDGSEPGQNAQLAVTYLFPTLARGWQ